MPTTRDVALIARLTAEGRVRDASGKLIQGPAPTPSPAATISEEEFQAAVEDLARRNGWLVYHTRDSRKSKEGFPDVVALRAGRQVVAELKVGDNRPTAAQETWLEAWRLVPGAEVFVWRPTDWTTIEATLGGGTL